MQERVIDRIRKLLRLSESANVHEAANAAERAQHLLEKHRIDRAVIELDGSSTSDPEAIIDDENHPLERSGRLANWKVSLTDAICKVNAATHYIGIETHYNFGSARSRSVRTICLVGRPSDLAIVRFLYSHFHNEIERLCRQHGRGQGRSWANSFRHGAIHAIGARLQDAQDRARREARDRLQGDTQALVRLDQALANLDARSATVDEWVRQFLKLVPDKRRGVRLDASGYHEGIAAGRQIDLADDADGYCWYLEACWPGRSGWRRVEPDAPEGWPVDEHGRLCFESRREAAAALEQLKARDDSRDYRLRREKQVRRALGA